MLERDTAQHRPHERASQEKKNPARKTVTGLNRKREVGLLGGRYSLCAGSKSSVMSNHFAETTLL